MGGVGEAFRAQARVQKGAGKALGSVIAEGDFRRAFPDSFQREVVRSKSLFSVPPRSVRLISSFSRQLFRFHNFLLKFFQFQFWRFLSFWCGCGGVSTLPVFCRFGMGVGAGVGVFFIFRTTSRICPTNHRLQWQLFYFFCKHVHNIAITTCKKLGAHFSSKCLWQCLSTEGSYDHQQSCWRWRLFGFERFHAIGT